MTHQAKAADLYRRACEVAEVAIFIVKLEYTWTQS